MDKFKNKYETLSLVTTKHGKRVVPLKSGLNWGQRAGRNENQAYIAVPAYIQRSDFFPISGDEFVIEWDDGMKCTCVRAQQNGKAIQTPRDNAILGRYFRARLGVKLGFPVLIDHLLKYGRTEVDIFKIEEKLFFADFKPAQKNSIERNTRENY